MTISELQAMISLLDDSDAEIVNIVTHDLVSKGYSMYDVLEEITWSGNLDSHTQEQLEMILQRIVFRQIKPQIEVLIMQGCEKHLLEILCLAAKITYPHHANNTCQKSLDELIKSLARDTNPTYGITRNISEFNRVFYDTYRFRTPQGNNQHLITNFMLNDVLASKIGNNTLLSLVYWLLANNLKWELCVEPVILPNTILLAAKNAQRSSPRYAQIDIAFYINPADKGNIHSRKEITNFLEDNNIGYTENMLQPDKIENLLHAYLIALSDCCLKNNRTICAKEMKELAALIV